MFKIVIFILLILSSIMAFSEESSKEVLSSLKDYKEYAVENSLELMKSQIDLEESKDDVESIFKITETELDFDTDYEDDEFEYEASITIPIIEQLKLNGSYNDEDRGKKGYVGMTLKPFDWDYSSKKSQLSYDSALLTSEKSLLDVQSLSMESALDWMSSYRSLELADLKSSYYGTIYNDSKERYQSGTITLDDLQDAFIDWSDAKKSLLSSRESFDNSEFELYSNLGASSDRIEIVELSVEELKAELNQLKDFLQGKESSFSSSLELQIAAKELEKERVTTDSIWFYEPDISASVGWDFDEEGVDMEDFSASINFSITLDDFQASELDRARRSYDISRKEYELELEEEKLEQELLITNTESSALETEIYNLEYEEAGLLLEEARLLYSAGEYSEMDLLNSSIYLKQAENSLFNALKSEYLHLLDYLKYL